MCSFILKAGRGYITVSAEEEEFEVLHPAFKMDNVFEQGDHYEGHIMAVYHQLHCLVSFLSRHLNLQYLQLTLLIVYPDDRLGHFSRRVGDAGDTEGRASGSLC